jgi:TatD DNase family protein
LFNINFWARKENFKARRSVIEAAKVVNMKLVDAHIHLSDPEYAGHTDMIVADAKASNVAALVSNSSDYQTSIESLRLAQKYPDTVYAALGIHPWNVNSLKESELEDTFKLISEQAQNRSMVAIGEIGLDCKYETSWEKQLMVFDKMLRLAEKLNLPVVVHSRGTAEFIVETLPSYNLKHVLLHWFSHPLSALYEALDHDYYITEGPPIVYSNGIREVVTKVPLTNFLTETDGPVLFRKAPFNSQMTKPSFVNTVVNTVAEIKKMHPEEVAEQIVKNFETFFNVKIT